MDNFCSKGRLKMYQIHGKRGSGKTTKCFERARKMGAAVLCLNKRALRVKADDLGYSDIELLELSDMKDTPLDQKIVVDEALLMFKRWLEKAYSVKVDAVSFTEE